MEDIYSDEILKEYRKKNWSNAIDDFKKKKDYIMDKIENIAEDYGMGGEEIYNTIKNSQDEELKTLFIAVRLAKDPKRQNIYENIFYDFLTKKGRKLKKLPTGGKNALFLTKNNIANSNQLNSESIESTKSLDFCEKIGNKIFYYYHKYTKVEGGAQGNQYIDLQTFVRIANKYCKKNNDNANFVAVADGPFYNKERMQELINLAGEFLDNRIFVVKWNTILAKVK